MAEVDNRTALELALGMLGLIKVVVDSTVVARDIDKEAMALAEAVIDQTLNPEAYKAVRPEWEPFVKSLASTIVETCKVAGIEISSLKDLT